MAWRLDAKDDNSFTATDRDREKLLVLLSRYLPTQEFASVELLLSWTGTRPPRRNPRSRNPWAMPTLHGPGKTGQDAYFAYSGGY